MYESGCNVMLSAGVSDIVSIYNPETGGVPVTQGS